jgi:hypothetical protein
MTMRRTENGAPDPSTRIISKKWRAEAVIMNAVTLVDVTETYTSDVDLETEGYYASHVIIDVNFGAAPEYNAVITIYASLDGANYDDTAMFSQEIDKDTDPNQISLIIQDVAHFRIGVKQGGVVTNDAVVTIKEQSWRLQST